MIIHVTFMQIIITPVRPTIISEHAQNVLIFIVFEDIS